MMSDKERAKILGRAMRSVAPSVSDFFFWEHIFFEVLPQVTFFTHSE